MTHYNKFRVRKSFLGKSILQQWHCYPSGIPTALANTCSWVDVSYKSAPQSLLDEQGLTPVNEDMIKKAIEKEKK